MRMASSSEEVAVFTDTNLGTRIAMAVSPGISVGDFKSKLRTKRSLYFLLLPIFIDFLLSVIIISSSLVGFCQSVVVFYLGSADCINLL